MKVILKTLPNAEDNAMLQALYSRSSNSVLDHAKKIETTGSGKFMSQFYLGYGHASIADCGFVTLYFEGISMLAAKAIEDSPLFNGQECSSRYIDFSKQDFHNPFPVDSKEYSMTAWVYYAARKFYVEAMEPLKAHIREYYPKSILPGAPDIVYEKTVAARAFDILRGFLPAGATTNVAWTTSLRKAHEHLVLMMHHPLYEIRVIAWKAYAELYAAYPNSFKKELAELINRDQPDVELQNLEGDEVYDYRSHPRQFYASHKVQEGIELLKVEKGTLFDIEVVGFVPSEQSYVKNRPKYEPLPRHYLSNAGMLNIASIIDFGSFRDIQRHRGGYCSNPVIDGTFGFHSWYMDMLPESLRKKAQDLLHSTAASVHALRSFADSEENAQALRTIEAQYLFPMGTLVSVVMNYSIPQAIYVSELRSGKTVHPTLRPLAQHIAEKLQSLGFPTYADMDESSWTEKRGTQDIVAK